MFDLRNAWRRLTSTRYTRLLEQELARLRAENRALLNSILGIAGIPPITVPLPPPTDFASSSPARAGVSTVSDSSQTSRTDNAARPTGRVPVPLRRRSWHQINRTLEIDSARKQERASPNPVPFP